MREVLSSFFLTLPSFFVGLWVCSDPYSESGLASKKRSSRKNRKYISSAKQPIRDEINALIAVTKRGGSTGVKSSCFPTPGKARTQIDERFNEKENSYRRR